MKKLSALFILAFLFFSWTLLVASVQDDLWQDNGDGSISPRSGKSVTIDTTSTSLIRVVEKTAATYVLGTDSNRDSKGTYFINADDDAIAFTLDAAAAGKSACFENKSGVTGAVTVTPGAGDYLVKQGVRGTAATAYTSSGAAGDKLCVLCIDDSDWQITTEVGTWSE